MTFGKSISSCYRNYFNIKGKASRSEYWWFQLYGVIVGLILAFIFMPFITNREVDYGFVILLGSFFPLNFPIFSLPSFSNLIQNLEVDYGFVIVLVFFFFLFFIPCITCEIRRFADGGLSRWLVLSRFVLAVLAYIPWGDFFFLAKIPIFIIVLGYAKLLMKPSKEVNVANQQHEQ